MATANHKRALHAEEATAFSGMNGISPCGGLANARAIKNFKLLSDGSLCRRDGFAHLRGLDAPIRAVTVRHEAEGDFLLAVAGNRFYRISLADGSGEGAALLSTEEGEALFFAFDGVLYLSDGTEIYQYGGGLSLAPAAGYIPLYGQNWDQASSRRPIHEPINLLSQKIRVHYLLDEMSSMMRMDTGLDVVSVDRVFADGVEITDYTVEFSDAYQVLRFGGSVTYKREVEVCLTLERGYWHDAVLRSCTHLARYDSFSCERLFFYGGEAGGALFGTVPVSEEALAASQRMDEGTSGIYVPKGRQVAFGDGKAITAVCRVGDRMMICSENRSWITEQMGEISHLAVDKLPVRSLSQTLGCRVLGGVAVLDGEIPVTLSEGGIYRWSIDPKMERECEVTRISDGIAEEIDTGFSGGARIFRPTAEDALWVCPAGDGDGRVWIYSCEKEHWVSYTGIGATHLFETGGGVGFAEGGDLYRFENGRQTDLLPYGEREIVASFESRRMDFGDVEARKKAVRLYVEAEADGGELTVGLYDGALLDEASFRGDAKTRLYTARVNTPRFHRLSAVIRVKGNCPWRICGMCVHIGM